MTDDIIFLSPGQPPYGRDGFSSNYSAALKQIQFNCVSELDESRGRREVAYTRSRDSLSVTPHAGGETTHLAAIASRSTANKPGGHWLLARDAHTLSPAAK